MIRLKLSPIDSFQHVSVNGHLRRIKSDVSVLLQQDIIDSLPRSFIDNLINGNDNPIDTSSMSDDDLISTCKSRYIQSPSELRAWSKSLDINSNYIKSYLDSLKSNPDISSDSLDKPDKPDKSSE